MKPNDQYEHKGTHKIATIIEVIKVLKSESLFSGRGNIKLKKRAVQGYRVPSVCIREASKTSLRA